MPTVTLLASMNRPKRLPPSMSVYGVSFRTLLVHLLRVNRMTNTELGRRVGRTQASVTQVVLGQTRPPLDEIDHWATALHLTGETRGNFIKLAHLSHVSDYTAGLIHELETTLGQQGEQIQKLQTAVTRLERERLG